ncbi:hypothetical protein I7I48_05484 [Histoplasma ohiense]|nr:hypothetical protein I7I48_05484 [Histoplasma ohiense (nom. inval.)]
MTSARGAKGRRRRDNLCQLFVRERRNDYLNGVVNMLFATALLGNCPFKSVDWLFEPSQCTSGRFLDSMLFFSASMLHTCDWLSRLRLRPAPLSQIRDIFVCQHYSTMTMLTPRGYELPGRFHT